MHKHNTITANNNTRARTNPALTKDWLKDCKTKENNSTHITVSVLDVSHTKDAGGGQSIASSAGQCVT